jgi:excisionase family DNA binding protein
MARLALVTDLTERFPTREEIDSAAEAATVLAQASAAGGCIAITGANGRDISLAPAVSSLVVDMLLHVARGEMVTLVPVGAVLTTQQAADMLNVSRPYISGLLKRGEIPFTQVGSHRRVRFVDLAAYKRKHDSVRDDALRELARLGQEFDAA